MARTAGSAIKTTTGGKSTKGRIASSSSSVSSSGGTTRKVIGKAVHQPIPKWQQSISSFIKKNSDVTTIETNTTDNKDTNKDSEVGSIQEQCLNITQEILDSTLNQIDVDVDAETISCIKENNSDAAPQSFSKPSAEILEKENNSIHSNVQSKVLDDAAGSSASSQEAGLTQHPMRKLKNKNKITIHKKSKINFANLEQFEVDSKK